MEGVSVRERPTDDGGSTGNNTLGKSKKKSLRFDFSVECQGCRSKIRNDDDGVQQEDEEVVEEEVPSDQAAKIGRRHSLPGEGGGAMDESFIVLHSRGKNGGNKPQRRQRRATMASAERRNDFDETELSRKEKLISQKRDLLALNFGYTDNDDPENYPEIHMMRPKIGRMMWEGEIEHSGDPHMKWEKPLCLECLNMVQDIMRRESLEQCQLQYHISELDKKLQRQYTAGEDGDDHQAFEAELTRLMQMQNEAMMEISEIERARASVRTEQERLDVEDAHLQDLENFYWGEFTARFGALDQVSERRDSLMSQIYRAKKSLKELSPIHAFNDAFFIWRDGDYGTINGFRLGQLVVDIYSTSTAKTKCPTWEEVNTAWGLSAMLLNAIAQSSNFTFSDFVINPMGSRTTIRRLGASRSTLDYLTNFASRKQYGSYSLFFDYNTSKSVLGRLNGLIVTRKTLIESFNNAMRGFIICLYQLTTVAINSESGQTLKLGEKMYSVDIPEELPAGDRGIPPNSCTINGDSVDMNHSPDLAPMTDGSTSQSQETPSQQDIDHAYRWTIALRHVLTNLKWLLVWSVREKKIRQL